MNSTTNWGTSIQRPEPVGDIPIQAPHRYVWKNKERVITIQCFLFTMNQEVVLSASYWKCVQLGPPACCQSTLYT